MPKNWIDLKDRRVAFVVLALLVLIVGINAHVFKDSWLPSGKSGENAGDELPVPSDLGAAKGQAVSQLAGLGGLAGFGGLGDAGGLGGTGDLNAIAAASENAGRSGRDPFNAQPLTSPTPTNSSRRAVAPRGPRLQCDAVLLGGDGPLALIDGKPCRLGDRVGSYRVLRIDADGVLVGNKQKHLFLVVGKRRADGVDYSVVTSLKRPGAEGQTAMDEAQ